jgi:hypothetical protein
VIAESTKVAMETESNEVSVHTIQMTKIKRKPNKNQTYTPPALCTAGMEQLLTRLQQNSAI